MRGRAGIGCGPLSHRQQHALLCPPFISRIPHVKHSRAPQRSKQRQTAYLSPGSGRLPRPRAPEPAPARDPHGARSPPPATRRRESPAESPPLQTRQMGRPRRNVGRKARAGGSGERGRLIRVDPLARLDPCARWMRGRADDAADRPEPKPGLAGRGIPRRSGRRPDRDRGEMKKRGRRSEGRPRVPARPGARPKLTPQPRRPVTPMPSRHQRNRSHVTGPRSPGARAAAQTPNPMLGPNPRGVHGSTRRYVRRPPGLRVCVRVRACACACVCVCTRVRANGESALRVLLDASVSASVFQAAGHPSRPKEGIKDHFLVGWVCPELRKGQRPRRESGRAGRARSAGHTMKR